ncbi:MAG TPA: CBS domain-containing protein [Gaiellaceae bacterium]|nr:CBS domain-containing protein [Gaiellaceae bacterium]
MRVEQIMTRDVLTIGPEAEVRDVARIFVASGISGMPVCGAQREVVGIISEGDILFKERGPAKRKRLSRLSARATKQATKTNAIKVLDAMTSPAITVSWYCSVAEAARLMSEYGVNRLPVMKGEELVGIVTRTDLVRAFVRSDAEIREEIEEDLIRRTFWLEAPDVVVVEVERGAVRLIGRVDNRGDAELLERLTARVPGVVSVQADLTWRADHTTREAMREIDRSLV